jgi:hypothetical protein
MLNALKTPSHFINAVEDLNSGTVFKSKRYVLALVFIFMLVAVVVLLPDRKEKQGLRTTASSQNSQEKPLAPPVEELESKPLPEKNKLEQVEQDPAIEHVQKEPMQNVAPSTFLQSEKMDLTYKKDQDYLAMNRFERPSLESKVPVTPGTHVREPTAVVDKPLALAGRGFDIQGFQSPARQVVQADFLEHLKRPVRKMKPVRQERLDLQLTQAKSSKHLIFHPLRPALSQFQKPTHWEDPESQKKLQGLDSIPETKLFFTETEKSQLILRPRRESLDLLIGNEKLNRREYGSW